MGAWKHVNTLKHELDYWKHDDDKYEEACNILEAWDRKHEYERMRESDDRRR